MTMDNGFDPLSAAGAVSRNLVTAVADLAPRFLVAVVVIILGLVVAKLAEKLIRVFCERLKIDALLERTGVTGALRRMGLSGSPGRLLARTVYFLLIVLFTQSVCRAVGLPVIADAIGSFFSYLPNLVAAFLVLLLGMILSQFVGRTITRSAEESGLEYGGLLGRSVSALVMFVVVIMALSQLRIDTAIIRLVVLVLLAAVAVAIALSFGLGTRDVTRNIVAGFYVRRLVHEGELLEIDGHAGTVVGVTPLQTLLEQDGRTLAVPNQVFLDKVFRS
ncbi:MAG: mechanosensitive ion channel [Candidatus Krumholzibacteria bacterium]|jgi:small-conductance mechanosensitive channel|nr:mechanosensitive ion channel [Candidatus Krumholzibacteria bacterium]